MGSHVDVESLLQLYIDATSPFSCSWTRTMGGFAQEHWGFKVGVRQLVGLFQY